MKRSKLPKYNQEEGALLRASFSATPLVMLPFWGSLIPVRVKRLNQVQIKSCADFSLIKGAAAGAIKRPDIDTYIDANRIQHQIAREALASPSYAQFVKILEVGDTVKRHRAELEELRDKVKTMKQGPAKKQALREIDIHMLWTEFPLPNDFATEVFNIAVSNDTSDIDKVTEDMLVDAAVMAERGHDNPADHIQGTFTDFNRDDINTWAWYLLSEIRKKK